MKSLNILQYFHRIGSGDVSDEMRNQLREELQAGKETKVYANIIPIRNYF